MEGENYIEMPITERAQWQWQCDNDPWKDKDLTKWTWENFPFETSLLIEQAFIKNIIIIDIGDYEIDLKRMVQVNKESRNRVRRIRRHEESRFLMEMPEPIMIEREQKTMNEAFGTVQHFLDYIMKRTDEAYRLYQRLRGLSLDCNQNEYQSIVEEVILCIEKGAEAREKVIKTRSGCKIRNFIPESKKIVDVIRKSSGSLRDFLKVVLKIYTMETFLCYWLNELLRSEDWEEINVLTPYLVCLVYSFKFSDCVIQRPKGFVKSLLGVFKRTLCLYRGTALTKEQLALYDCSKAKHFSWNALTSTSRCKKMGEKFVHLSVADAQELKQSKVGVLFKIKADFTSFQDCEGMIDISQISKYPKEQEIILAPGTVFKLKSKRLLKNNIYEIKIKIRKSFKDPRENIPILGILQDRAIWKDKAIIDGLPSQDGFKVLKLIEGNKLIQKLEIKNSEISEHIMEIIENVRITTNVKKGDIRFEDNTISICSLSALAWYYSEEALSGIFEFNKIRFVDANVKNDWRGKNWQMKSLNLEEGALRNLRDNRQLGGFWQKMKNERQLKSLNISLYFCDWEFKNFLECLRSFQNLESLTFEVLIGFSGEEMNSFSQIIDSLASLEDLFLDIWLSEGILNYLRNRFQKRRSFRRLSFELKQISRISNEGLKWLQDFLILSLDLRHLHLELGKGKGISDEGVSFLKDGLMQLKSLQHLSLDLKYHFGISVEGINLLMSAIVPLKSLEHLSLHLRQCEKFSDEGLNYLKSALISLVLLQYLDLNFYGCAMISDEGVSHLKDGLIQLKSLQHLSLDFRSSQRISDEGFSHLKDGLMHLTSLHYLSLRLSSFPLSSVGVRHLQGAIFPLQSLEHLSLKFDSCEKFSDEGLNHLKGGLRSLVSLQHLDLNFSGCRLISDEGVYHLKEGLVQLKSLQHLSLSFGYCSEISDESVTHLMHAILLLKSLQNLHLDFSGVRVSRKAISILTSALIGLDTLQDIHLDFNDCDGIENQLKGLVNEFRQRRKIDRNSSFHLKVSSSPSDKSHFLSDLSNDGIELYIPYSLGKVGQ